MTVLVGAARCRCTPPFVKVTPSASSAATTRCRARALALGTLPLDPSQAVRQGREIEARSASSCCERPVILRAARSMPPVISTIVMSRLFARRQRASMSAYFTNSLTPPTGLGLLGSLRAAGLLPVGQRVARSLPERWPAVPAARGKLVLVRFKAIDSRTGEGQPDRCPFLIGSRNGRQDARPCFARRPVAALRRRRLDFGSPYFGFGLFCARSSGRSRHSLAAVTLNVDQLVLKRAPRLPACPPSRVRPEVTDITDQIVLVSGFSVVVSYVVFSSTGDVLRYVA